MAIEPRRREEREEGNPGALLRGLGAFAVQLSRLTKGRRAATGKANPGLRVERVLRLLAPRRSGRVVELTAES